MPALRAARVLPPSRQQLERQRRAIYRQAANGWTPELKAALDRVDTALRQFGVVVAHSAKEST